MNGWHRGYPPSSGWWPARAPYSSPGLRWFDKPRKQWSVHIWPDCSVKAAAIYAKLPAKHNDILWAERPDEWPARSKT